jgi:hypothetical protein
MLRSHVGNSAEERPQVGACIDTRRRRGTQLMREGGTSFSRPWMDIRDIKVAWESGIE